MDLKSYFKDFDAVLTACLNDSINRKGIEQSIDWIRQTKDQKTKIMLVGNGGSAGIAEHMAIDLTKNAGLRAMAISGTPMLTTFANDFGYEKVFQKGIEVFADKGDVLIAISSGGTSKSILNACTAAKAKGMTIITFSGFAGDNPLRKMGDANIWVDSRAFGYVEMIHHVIIHYINDAIIGKAEYMIR
jgi:D-sedoheptulose 7-phosphate isomerase